MTKKPVFTTFEAAKLCHVSPLSIINWVNAGRLAAFRTPGGHRRIRREDLIFFMRENGLPLPDDLMPGAGRKKVLIVDDEPGICDLLAQHLSGRPGEPFESVRLHTLDDLRDALLELREDKERVRELFAD